MVLLLTSKTECSQSDSMLHAHLANLLINSNENQKRQIKGDEIKVLAHFAWR